MLLTLLFTVVRIPRDVQHKVRIVAEAVQQSTQVFDDVVFEKLIAELRVASEVPKSGSKLNQRVAGVLQRFHGRVRSDLGQDLAEQPQRHQVQATGQRHFRSMATVSKTIPGLLLRFQSYGEDAAAIECCWKCSLAHHSSTPTHFLL